MNFVAIDVETANPDMASICQVGIARFSGGRVIAEWTSLVDPEDYFDGLNVSIHGITEERVHGKPKIPELAPRLRELLGGAICVCHTHFERVSFRLAFDKYRLAPLEATWLDSARVARRTWSQFARSGYGLANVCEEIGYEFHHHDALEDAKACGQILLAAIRTTELDVEAWLHRVNCPIDSESTGPIRKDGNPQGPMFGEVVVFTGSLEITRGQAAELAARVGCDVAPGVSKKTTILVVGDQDLWKLGGHEKSAKHRRAEQLKAQGVPLRIVKESDFRAMVTYAEV